MITGERPDGTSAVNPSSGQEPLHFIMENNGGTARTPETRLLECLRSSELETVVAKSTVKIHDAAAQYAS